jgi:hypothetical protein
MHFFEEKELHNFVNTAPGFVKSINIYSTFTSSLSIFCAYYKNELNINNLQF